MQASEAPITLTSLLWEYDKLPRSTGSVNGEVLSPDYRAFFKKLMSFWVDVCESEDALPNNILDLARGSSMTQPLPDDAVELLGKIKSDIVDLQSVVLHCPGQYSEFEEAPDGDPVTYIDLFAQTLNSFLAWVAKDPANAEIAGYLNVKMAQRQSSAPVTVASGVGSADSVYPVFQRSPSLPPTPVRSSRESSRVLSQGALSLEGTPVSAPNSFWRKAGKVALGVLSAGLMLAGIAAIVFTAGAAAPAIIGIGIAAKALAAHIAIGAAAGSVATAVGGAGVFATAKSWFSSGGEPKTKQEPEDYTGDLTTGHLG